MCSFVIEYTHYVAEKRSKSASRVYDDFVELLRKSDIEEKECLMRQLTQDCEDMGIELDVQIKRQKMENN